MHEGPLGLIPWVAVRWAATSGPRGAGRCSYAREVVKRRSRLDHCTRGHGATGGEWRSTGSGAGVSARRAHGCSDGRARGQSRELRERQESYDYRMLRAPSRGGGQDKSRDHERRGERISRVWVKHRVPPGNREPHDRQGQPRIGAWTGGHTQPQTRTDTHQGEDPQDRRSARTPTGRPDQGKRPPGPDLYPVTVSYSAAYRAPGPAVAGFSVLRRSPRPPHSRPTSRPLPATPPRIAFPAYPSRIRGMAARHSRRTKRYSRRTFRRPRQRDHLSVQPAW